MTFDLNLGWVSHYGDVLEASDLLFMVFNFLFLL